MTKWLSGKKKIITMILGVVSGLAIAFGLDQGDISTISGAVVAAMSVISYIAAEGTIDAERVKNAAAIVIDAVDAMTGEDGADDGE